jgi:hypothetical protein
VPDPLAMEAATTASRSSLPVGLAVCGVQWSDRGERPVRTHRRRMPGLGSIGGGTDTETGVLNWAMYVSLQYSASSQAQSGQSRRSPSTDELRTTPFNQRLLVAK